jgi:hypothetical protein
MVARRWAGAAQRARTLRQLSRVCSTASIESPVRHFGSWGL